jgi:mRNA degradation ribonuclease J1/J2
MAFTRIAFSDVLVDTSASSAIWLRSHPGHDKYHLLWVGVNEIGGNKILLEDKDTRIFLDFGKGFSRRVKFFEKYIDPRVANGIEDFLTMGLLPDAKGLYRDDLMKMAEREILELDKDAVLLTHAHSDIADYISFLHEKIPFYMGDTCHYILQAIEERSNGQIEREVLSYIHSLADNMVWSQLADMHSTHTYSHIRLCLR